MAKVGTSFIDITDLTETLPLTLMLETNRDQNVQIKNGDLYTPNFKEGEGLIITPSLFIGQTEIIPFPYENIRYQVGEKDSENNTELDFSYANKHGYSDISVDKEGRLIYKKNLEKDLTIEARIEGYKHKDQDDIVASSVIASNPKTILFLEQGSNLYNLIITSENGREHFEESNREPILLKAILYKGAQEVTNVTYEWDIVTDTDTDSNEDNNYPSGPDFRVIGQDLEVQRSWVSTLEVFQCTATLNDGSNLKFEAQKIIRDFVDNFSATIISDKARILNPENSEITLTNNIYHLGNLVTDTSRITSYSWFLFYKNQEEKLIQEGISNTLAINLNTEGNIFPKEDFSILCVALIDGKERVVAYTDIIYRETFYRPVVSPKTIFVPVNKDGIPTLKTFSHEIKFQLVDDGNNVLDYIGQTSFAPSLKSNDNSSFGDISQTIGKWEFKIPFSLDLSNNNDFWISNSNSKMYEFTYTYLNTEFTEEFEVVKNYAGQDGKDGSPGFSGYTIDLSNEFHAFSGGEMRADSNQSTSCLVSAYFGDARKTIKKIEIGNINNKKEIYPTSNEIEYIVPNNKGYLYFSSQKKQDNEININIKTATNGNKFLTGIEPIPIYITIEGQDGKDLIFLKTFTYTINYNGKSYFLNLSDNNIKYSEPTNTYSPNQITISALCRETSGAARAYSEGKIIYSIDEGKSWKYYGNSPIVTNNGTKLESIIVRLYSALAKGITSSATLNDNLLNENSIYLLDMETIPVLTSMDGYQFGGENLIKWSKELPIASNKWVSSHELLTIGQDGEFSTLDFNVPTFSSGDQSFKNFKTPRIKLDKEYIGKTFCFSCYIYSDNWSLIDNSYVSVVVIGATTFEPLLNASGSWIREGYNSILQIDKNGPASDFVYDSWENKKWIKISKTFVLTEDFFTKTDLSSTDKPNITDYNYIYLNFYLGEKGNLRIKKPKLELGNIPTAWSASPYDIDYTSISANLIPLQSTYYVTLKNTDPFIVIGEELLGNTTYCLSWNSCDYDNSSLTTLTYAFFIGNNYQSSSTLNLASKNYQVISIPQGLENVTVRLYGGELSKNEIQNINNLTTVIKGQTYIFKQLKFALGDTPTDYVISSTELIEQLLTLKDDINNTSDNIPSENRIIEIIGTNGSKFFATTEALGSLTGTVTEVGNKISQTSTMAVTNKGNIELLSTHFKVVTDSQKDPNAPYIELIVDTAKSDNQIVQMRLSNDQLMFYTTDEVGSDGKIDPLAYFNSNKLYVKRIEVTENLRLGKSKNDNGIGFLNMQYDTEGVFFTWENN